MPVFKDPHGKTVTAADALIGGKLRPGFTETVSDGDYVGFQSALMDSPPSRSSIFLNDAEIAPRSIDEALKRELAEVAKRASKSPTEYLKGCSPDEIETMIARVAKEIVETGIAEGVAAVISFDNAAFAVRTLIDAERRLADAPAEVGFRVAEMRAAHDRKHAFMGDRAPPFDTAAATLIALSKIDNGHASVRDSIRDASYR